MSLDAEILDLLRCPMNGRPVIPADASIVSAINAGIRARSVENVLGQTVEQPIEAALLDDTGKWLMPIRNGIIGMVREQVIETSQAAGYH
jgi:hypothetical protein